MLLPEDRQLAIAEESACRDFREPWLEQLTSQNSSRGNRGYCYPLTITDFASRYLLTCEALLTTQEKFAFTVFERTSPTG
jgi:hypothetical protein